MQSHLSLNASVSLRRGDVTFKLLVDKVTEEDKELVRNTEIELSTNALKEFSCDVSKLSKGTTQLIDTSNSNAALKTDHANIILRAFADNECVEEFRLHIMQHQRDLIN